MSVAEGERHRVFNWPSAATSSSVPWWQSPWFIWPAVLTCFAALAGIGAWAAAMNVAPSTQPAGTFLLLLSDAGDDAALGTGQSIPWVTARYLSLNVANDVAVGCARLASAGELTLNSALIAETPAGVGCDGWVYWTPELAGPVAAMVSSDGSVSETPYTPTTSPPASDRHAAWVIINAPSSTQAREIMFTLGFAVLGLWTLPGTISALTPPTV